jgi:hypothetical protein
MHQSCLFELLGSYIKKIYVLKQVWDQENIQKIDDKICPSEFWPQRQVLKTIWNHIKGSFFLLL